MIEYILTTAKELDNESVGTVIIDPNGHAWQKGNHTKTISGAIRSAWFNAISGKSHMSDTLEKYGPYTVIYTPAQTDPVVTPNYEYSTPAELHLLDNLPDGYTVQDNDGRTWERTGGFWQSGLTGADNLSRKHTPYTITKAPDTPEPTEEPQREYTTVADLEELDNAPIGTIVKDKEGDEWVKARNGWLLEANGSFSLYVAYAPYTVVHTPPSDLANL